MKYLSLICVFTLLSCSTGAKKEEGSPAKGDGKEMAKKDEKAKESEAAPKMDGGKLMVQVSCALNKDNRTLASYQQKAGGCAVKYTKWGKTDEIGSAENDLEHCSGLVDKVKGNLENAGFTCK